MQELLGAAKDEIRHLRAQQDNNSKDIQNAISLLDPKTMSSAEACVQLKRCMELSLANQKLLDELFLDKQGVASRGSMESSLGDAEGIVDEAEGKTKSSFAPGERNSNNSEL